MRLFPTLLLSTTLLACGDDAKRPADTADTSPPADTSADTTAPEDGADGADAADTSAPADTTDDTADSAGPGDTDTSAPDGTTPDTYITGCGSLFAARVVERQIGLDAAFPKDCDAPLTSNVGLLRQGGKPLCVAGESANACRERLYDTPPAMDDLEQACRGQTPSQGCLLGKFLPRCADGTDGCAEDEAVCWDGMRPMVYAEAATAGASKAWWFHMGGEGGPCWGAQCWGNYRFGENEFRFAMSTLHPDGPSRAGNRAGGVLSGDPDLPYGKFNRVRFERCTDAASDTTEEVPIADGVPAEYAAQFPGVPVATGTSMAHVWHRGFDTWRAAFRSMTTTAGRDLDGDGTPELPSLADAEVVILSASSDASMWVTLAADRLADELRAIAGADVEVRVMIDGMFPPMLDNEARYHADVPADFDMLSMPYGETGLCRLDDNGDGVDNEGCSDASYSEGGQSRTGFERRGLLLDASCQAMHGADAPECFDRNHTLIHHLDVPVLVLADQEDNTVSDTAPTYADDRTYFWEEPANYRKRIADQGWDLVDHFTTAAREEGAGAAEDFILILPKTRREGEPWGKATHVRFGDDAEMARAMTLCGADQTKIATASYTQMIAGWLGDSLPLTFAIEDKRRALPNGSYWVTGPNCRAAE